MRRKLKSALGVRDPIAALGELDKRKYSSDNPLSKYHGVDLKVVYLCDSHIPEKIKEIINGDLGANIECAGKLSIERYIPSEKGFVVELFGTEDCGDRGVTPKKAIMEIFDSNQSSSFGFYHNHSEVGRFSESDYEAMSDLPYRPQLVIESGKRQKTKGQLFLPTDTNPTTLDDVYDIELKILNTEEFARLLLKPAIKV